MRDVMQTAGGDRGKRHGTLLRFADVCVALVVCTLTALLLVPADGALPGVNIDLSWPYTLADAAGRHIPFGRDVVFTFGPLSSIYTRFFLPDQRMAFTVLKLVLVVAFCLAAVAMSRRSLRWATLALPLLIANLFLSDSFFLVVPWVIVPLAAAAWRNRGRQAASLLALAAVLGPLLLVKGTLAIPLAASIGAAAYLASRRSRALALALPCVAAATIVVAWLAVGQHLIDLPYYLRREAYVASGYTDAMSSFGDPNEIWIYLAGAAVLLASQFIPRRAPAVPTLAAAAILFVAFKAGFVRHDLHANIAGGTLALLGFLMFLWRGGVASGVGLLAGLAAWLLIGAHYWPVGPVSSWNRLTAAIGGDIGAVLGAATDPAAFRRAFEKGKDRVAAVAALPPTAGIVDLYPNDQELLLASNRDYYPRPVMQSYSAYTPELAFLNADHLQGSHAPQTAFFDIAPIDEHYPAMEDGPSWPALLGQYRFRTYARSYAVLDRVAGAPAGAIDPPVISGTPRFGDSVTVPRNVPFVWVTMQFHPTLLGRLASALFKAPLIHMDVTTADGRTQTFRLVPGMASAGFLLSPTVASAHDFVALRSSDEDVFADGRVTAISLREDGGRNLWGDTFTVQFAPLRIPTDPAVDEAVLGHLDAGPPAGGLPTAGDCTIDTVGGMTVSAAPAVLRGATVTVTGWGFVSGPGAEEGGNLRMALTSADGTTAYAGADRLARPDVDAHFHLASPTRAGFKTQINLSALHGAGTLRIVQDTPSGTAVCGAPAAIVHLTAPEP